MKSVASVLLSITLLVCVEHAHAQAPRTVNLVVLSVDDQGASGGKPLKVTFAELKREAEYSIVEVAFTSGASVPSSLFVLRGMCTIMRSRGERYFPVDRLEQGPTKYKVTFPKVPPSTDFYDKERRFFAEQDCSLRKF
jgi:hypothetical protein